MKERVKTEKKVKAIQMALWTLAILFQMGIVKCLEVRAETEAPKASELTVRYGVETEAKDCEQPPVEYEDEDGTAYRLESWSAVPASIPGISRKVQKTVRYDQTEGVAALPETIEIEALDRERGQTVTAVCRMQEQEVVREEWQDGFVLPVTFHTYEAGYYQLADRLIPYNDARPELDGCEDLLLELAGLPPEDYRVDRIQWSGDVYQDADGNQCRDAAAYGQKRLRDYQITYSGTAVFPQKEGWQTVAVYRLPQTETAEVLPEPEVLETVRADTAADQAAAAPTPAAATLWERITRTLLVTIAAGAVLFFGGLLLLAIIRVVKSLRSCYNRKQIKLSGGKHDVYRK